jgi:hypothetical protein
MNVKSTMWIVRVSDHPIVRKFLSKYNAQRFIDRVLEHDKNVSCILECKDIWLTLPIG